MDKMLIPITTINEQSKMLEITTKSSALKKRYVKTWTADEDERLVALYQIHPKKWNLISQGMKNRNENQCLHRFRRICRLGQNKKIWSSHEDEVVLKMIAEVGHNWRLIAQELGTKSGKQIRQRFINKLDPSIRREEWTEDEDLKIIELYTQMGSKWCQISKCLPGRPQNRIKNRFYSYIQKNYDFKLKQGPVSMVNEPFEQKQNTKVTAGVRSIANHRPANSITSSLTPFERKSSAPRILEQRKQNTNSQKLQQPIKEQMKQEYSGFQKIEEQKQNNYNSLKEINDECFFNRYNSQVNNSDLLYFEDN